MKKTRISLTFVIPLILLILLYGSVQLLAQEVEANTTNSSSFSIKMAIPTDYKTVSPGDQLLASVKLVNLGSTTRTDVLLDYWVSDNQQNIILTSKETVAVETQASFVRTFDIPESAKSGKYTLYAEVTYADGREATANDSFEIAKKQVDTSLYYTVAAILALSILVYAIFKSKPLFEKLKIKSEVSMEVRKRKI